MLLTQDKVFVQSRQGGSMTKLVTCLNRERGTRWDVSANPWYSITRIKSSTKIK